MPRAHWQNPRPQLQLAPRVLLTSKLFLGASCCSSPPRRASFSFVLFLLFLAVSFFLSWFSFFICLSFLDVSFFFCFVCFHHWLYFLSFCFVYLFFSFFSVLFSFFPCVFICFFPFFPFFLSTMNTTTLVKDGTCKNVVQQIWPDTGIIDTVWN